MAESSLAARSSRNSSSITSPITPSISAISEASPAYEVERRGDEMRDQRIYWRDGVWREWRASRGYKAVTVAANLLSRVKLSCASITETGFKAGIRIIIGSE